MHTELRFSTDFVPNPFSALFLKLSGTFFLSHSCWLLEGLFSRWITLSTFFVFWLDFFPAPQLCVLQWPQKVIKEYRSRWTKENRFSSRLPLFFFLQENEGKNSSSILFFYITFFLLLLVWRGKRFVCITPRCGKTEKNGKTRRWREENLSSAHKKVHNERCKMHSGKNGDCFSTNGFSSFLQWCKIFKFHLGVWILLQTFRTK